MQSSTASKANLDLDAMERELGLSSGVSSSAGMDEPNSTWQSVPSTALRGGIIESAPPSAGNGAGVYATAGCIPTRWIVGAFAGSLPSAQYALLLDWAILNNERYAGMYFVAALFEVCSPSLLNMNGASIKEWLETVSHNGTDWYKLCNASVGNFMAVLALSSDEVEDQSAATQLSVISSWEAFLSGWIRATSGQYI